MAAKLSAAEALTRHFNEARSRLLDLAAILDRIQRGTDSGAIMEDARLVNTREAIAAILIGSADRTERVQMIFSLPHESDWQSRS